MSHVSVLEHLSQGTVVVWEKLDRLVGAGQIADTMDRDGRKQSPAIVLERLAENMQATKGENDDNYQSVA